MKLIRNCTGCSGINHVCTDKAPRKTSRGTK